jgi:hydrogenase maturation protease
MKVLVAGVGNVFLGDDGFGVQVAARLAGEAMPAGVRVADFGIRGVHLAYELLDGYDGLILVDAVPQGGPPGTLYVIEPDAAADAAPALLMDAHSMAPGTVFALLQGLGGTLHRAVVVGCEPAEITDRMGLSDVVAAAVERALPLVREQIDEMVTALNTERV